MRRILKWRDDVEKRKKRIVAWASYDARARRSKHIVLHTNEYMKVPIYFELRRMILRHDWSSQVYTKLKVPMK